jgi:hypothetical protein
MKFMRDGGTKSSFKSIFAIVLQNLMVFKSSTTKELMQWERSSLNLSTYVADDR